MKKMNKPIILVTTITCLLGAVLFSPDTHSNANAIKSNQVTNITTERLSKYDCTHFTTYPDIKLTEKSGGVLIQEALKNTYFDQNNLIVVAVQDQLNSLEEYYLDDVTIEDVSLHVTIKHLINGIVPPVYATAPSRYFVYLFEVDKGITSVLETVNDVDNTEKK